MHRVGAVVAIKEQRKEKKDKDEDIPIEQYRENLLVKFREAKTKSKEEPVVSTKSEKESIVFPTPYDRLAYECKLITTSGKFNGMIIGFILIAAVIVGIQTYDSLETNSAVVLCDNIVLGVFTAEVILKVVAEGRRPWAYATGPDRAWNLFDALIVLLCMPFVDLGGGVAFLRLLRLMRVTKIIKRVPQLQMIVMGLVQGMASIVYIMLLLSLVFYLFAVMGVFSFGANDPAHFGGLPAAALTLFRCSTLEDWTDVMYINIFGCDVFDGGLYTTSNTTEMIHSQIGTFFGYSCTNPQKAPFLSSVYFLFFTVVSAFVILSLFIGAVTMGMTTSIEALAEKKKEGNAEVAQGTINEAWLAQVLNDAFEKEAAAPAGPWAARYLRAAAACQALDEDHRFQNFMVLVILTAGVLVGLSTEIEDSAGIDAADGIVLAIFTAEVVIKLVACGRRPLRYFRDSWNRFDFFIVLSSYVPMMFGGDLGPLISMLRLLRLLRVLKLVKSLPQLRVIVEALIEGFNSITFITLILLLFFYVFAIVGMILFKANDPWHFGLLQDAMLTLFRCATLEDWTDVMYINMFGCANYGYGGMEELCDTSYGLGWLAALYFVVFVVLGALVLLTLFLGVVTTSMEKATAAMKEGQKLQLEVDKVVARYGLAPRGVELFRAAFDTIDLDEGGSLDFEELLPVLMIVGRDLSDEQVVDLYLDTDEDGSGDVDFAEFLEMMVQAKGLITGVPIEPREQEGSKRSSGSDGDSVSHRSSKPLLDAGGGGGGGAKVAPQPPPPQSPEEKGAAGAAGGSSLAPAVRQRLEEGQLKNQALKAELEALAERALALAKANRAAAAAAAAGGGGRCRGAMPEELREMEEQLFALVPGVQEALVAPV